MKNASAATLAILATGQYLKLEFYEFTLVDGNVLRFTNADVPVKVGSNTYQSNMVISRSSFRQKRGLEVQEMTLTMAAQWDALGSSAVSLFDSGLFAAGLFDSGLFGVGVGPVSVTLGGYPFLQGVNLGYLDFARVLFSKGFFNAPVLGVLDTSPGLVPWAQGKVSNAVASRSRAVVTVADDTQGLDVAMPRNVLQTGCVHSLFDAGCAVAPASAQFDGIVTAGATVTSFGATGLAAQPDGYFDLGYLYVTNGPMVGLRRTIKSYLNSGGAFTLFQPLPAPLSPGTNFTALAGCDKTQATCGGKFGNLAHFRGAPYIPVPETLYDGGTPNGPAPAIAGQGGAAAGSAFSGVLGNGTYEP